MTAYRTAELLRTVARCHGRITLAADLDSRARASLGRPGAQLWRAIVGDLPGGGELDRRELHLLKRACSAEDHLHELEAAVKRDGATVDGSRGQTVVHPALGEIRQLKGLADAAERHVARLLAVRPAVGAG